MTAFTEFCVGWRPFTRFLEIQFKRLIAVLILNIKVDNNVVLRDLHIMQSGCRQVTQLGRNFIPLGSWRLFSRSILSRTIRTFSVKDRFLFQKLNQFMFGLILLSERLIFKFLGSKANVITSHTSSVIEIESLLVIPEVVFQFLLKYPLREWEGNFCLVTIGFIHLP